MAHSLLNSQNVRALFLDRAKKLRPAWSPDRVSDSTLDKAEVALRLWIDGYIEKHPSVGKTIK
jgi:hypothetical protein